MQFTLDKQIKLTREVNQQMPTRDRPVRRNKPGIPGTRMAFWIVALLGIVVAIIVYNRQDTSVVEIVETLVEEDQGPPAPASRPPPAPVQREATAPGPVVSELQDIPVAPEKPLPALNESDQDVIDAISGISTSGQWLSWFQPEEMVRKLAVIVDNAARGDVARKDLSLPKPDAAFAATQDGDRSWLNENSYRRYDAYMDVLNTIDTDALAIVYRYYIPLFEEAYAELGYPDRTFDSSLNDAFDMILKTPAVTGDIELTGKSVAYEFADPELEALPPLTKQIIRMGPRNSQIFLAKTRELQASLAQDSN